MKHFYNSDLLQEHNIYSIFDRNTVSISYLKYLIFKSDYSTAQEPVPKPSETNASRGNIALMKLCEFHHWLDSGWKFICYSLNC